VASRQLATPGTAATNEVVISPWACRNRSSARVAVTCAFADQTLSAVVAWATMNAVTVAASSAANECASGSGKCARSLLAWPP
jgi:hypothetical protein